MDQPNPHRAPPPPIRLASKGEGRPFIDLINDLAGSPREGARYAAFFQEWDRLTDELGREPTIPEYAERWDVSVATVNRDLRAFREMFPTERTPSRILAVLWDGLDKFGPLMAVRVVAEESK